MLFYGFVKLKVLNLCLFHPLSNPRNHFSTVLIETNWYTTFCKYLFCPDDVFLFIDQNMPRHVVFILEYDNRYKVLLNYKEWKDGQNGHFKIIKTFATEWLTDNQLLLTLEGQNMDALYESIAGQVSGFGTKKTEDTKRIVELEGLIDKAKREVEAIQKRIRNERQLNRQMELNGEARGIKKQIAQWQNELQELKQ